MTGYLYLNPPEMIALQAEIARFHPKLQEQLNRHPLEIEEWFAEIATHVDIVLDGAYDVKELTKLCEILYKRLWEKRQIILSSIH